MPTLTEIIERRKKEKEGIEPKKIVPPVKNIEKPKIVAKKPPTSILNVNLDGITLNKSAKLNLLKLLYALYTDKSTTNKTVAQMKRVVDNIKNEGEK